MNSKEDKKFPCHGNQRPPRCHTTTTWQGLLLNTEKWLLKDLHWAWAYWNVFNVYLKNGYIYKEMPPPDKDKPSISITLQSWDQRRQLLRLEWCSTPPKLNGIIYPESKLLQFDRFDVLLHFWRFLVALVCDIFEMYLWIGKIPSNRPFHHLLWRDLDQSRPPKEY